MFRCRGCLGTPNPPVMLTEKDAKKFLQVTGIELHPNSDQILCESCFEVLLVAWNFRAEAQKADDWFKNQLDEVTKVDEVPQNLKVEAFPVVELTPMSDSSPIASPTPASPVEKVKIKEKIEYFYVCDICNEDFMSYKKIRDHITNHKKIFSHYCRFCNKYYENKRKLYYHETTHENGTNGPVVCETCGKIFPRKHELRMHKMTHAAKYTCELPGCGETFNRKKLYYRHFGTKHGNPHPCVCHCGKGFSNHVVLKNHQRKEHDLGPKLNCPHCPKQFLNQREIDRHVVSIHLGRKDYACKICTCKYFHAYNLKRHYRTSHLDTYLQLVKDKISFEVFKINQDEELQA
ncbi:zinc finger protein draculin-like [Culicoides brevitarsis]|uniref:zinc finger protein draculin-like n=1 Tax=Culicoides brevitarsis TaxID=469753 RepID=UPI00307B7DB0